MELPTVFRPNLAPLPPMYAWPRSVKRALLVLSLLAVAGAYVLLTGGIIVALLVLANRIGG